jgi:hypothetical protein
MYTTTLVSVLHLLISNELKQVTIVTRNLNVLEIMSRLIWKLYEQNLISEEVANILLDKLYE